MKAACMALAVVATLGASAKAATLSRFTSKEGREVITLSGEIQPGDAAQIVTAIQAANAAGRLVSGIRLSSPGGNLVEGVKIADTIRYAKVATVVVNGATCASACFVAFAAGNEKYASYGAAVGVHGASANGQETEGSRAATVAMAKVVKELGVPPGIIGQMVVTPPGEMVWLQPADLQAMGVTMTGTPGQVASPPVAAQMPAGGPPGPGLAATAGLAAAAAPAQDLNSLWKTMTDRAIAQSAKQNNGTASFKRSCQPELKLCNMAVFYVDDQGTSAMVRLAEDLDGKMVKRDVCTFNSFGDVRTCLDWDTSVRTREMKNSAGEWYAVQ